MAIHIHVHRKTKDTQVVEYKGYRILETVFNTWNGAHVGQGSGLLPYPKNSDKKNINEVKAIIDDLIRKRDNALVLKKKAQDLMKEVKHKESRKETVTPAERAAMEKAVSSYNRLGAVVRMQLGDL